jgi:hypothetical protein
MSTTVAPQASRATDTDACRGPRRRTRALAVVAATAATFTVWSVAVPFAGVDLTVRAGSGVQPVGPVAVVVTTVLAGLAGWGLLAALERFVRPAVTVWTVVAVAVLVVSLAGPLGATSAAGIGTLVAMHLAAGAVLIPILRNSSRMRRTAG